MPDWLWEILAGVCGAAAYYFLRYDPRGALKLVDYLKKDAWLFAQGVVAFIVIWGGWRALARLPLVPADLPDMSISVALLAGFAGKKFADYTVRRLVNIGREGAANEDRSH
jgi:hypothetical protein